LLLFTNLDALLILICSLLQTLPSGLGADTHMRAQSWPDAPTLAGRRLARSL